MASNSTDQVYGLKQVWPVSNVTASVGREVDIIVLHGLSATSPRTWIAWKVDGDRCSGDVNWLSDSHMLPAKMPTSRILTYSWNANYDANAAADIFLGHADSLLSQIHLDRKDQANPDAPILFVASCFGGLLLAKAIVRAASAYGDRRRDNQKIIESIIGINFLGTPFGGTNDTGREVAKMRIEVARHAAAADGTEYSQELISYLQCASADHPGHLDELVQQFTEFIHDPTTQRIPISCFYERRATKHSARLSALPEGYHQNTVDPMGQAIVVSRKSATLHGCNTVGLDVRHNMLHKFNHPTNVPFLEVAGRLQAFLEQHKERVNRSNTQEPIESLQPQHSQATLTECAKLMSVKGIDRRRLHFKLNPAAKNTCHWIFDTQEYRDWAAQSPGDPSFHPCILAGKAGSGKSTIMWELVEGARMHARAHGEICLAYFFDASNGTPLQNSLQGLYRQTLCQLLGEIWPTASLLQSVGEWDNSADMLSDITVLKQRILDISPQLYHRRITIYIDAVDECSHAASIKECVTDVLRFWMMLRKQGVNNAVCLSVRDHRCVTSGQPPFQPRIILVDQKNSDDIQSFIDESLERHTYPGFHEELTAELLRRSSNMFLWVKLVVDLINPMISDGAFVDEVREEVRKVPTALKDLYQALLNQLEPGKRTEALVLLRLTRVSVRPLTWIEVGSALGIAMGADYYGTLSARQFEGRVHDLCRGLIVFERLEHLEDAGQRRPSPGGSSVVATCQATVQFTHYSVREFLSQGEVVDGATRTKLESVSEAHWQTSQICMRAVRVRREGDGFLPYASQFWPTHAREGDQAVGGDGFGLPKYVTSCDILTSNLLDEYKKCVRESSVINFRGNVQSNHIANTRLMRDEDGLLALLAFEGCTKLVSHHIRSCRRANQCFKRLGAIDDAIYLAAYRGWSDTIREILSLAREHSIVVNINRVHPVKGHTPLLIACIWGHKEVVRCLIDSRGKDSSESKGMRLSAFHAASTGGRLGLMGLFQDEGNQYPRELLEAQDSVGCTVFHRVARSGKRLAFEELVRELENPESVMNQKTNGGKTVLDMAEMAKAKALKGYGPAYLVRDYDRIIELCKYALSNGER